MAEGGDFDDQDQGEQRHRGNRAKGSVGSPGPLRETLDLQEQQLADQQAGEAARPGTSWGVASLAVVVAGHWLVIPSLDGGVLSGRILYEVEPAFWSLTWAFDVFPLFFFVEGFANFTSYAARRGQRGDQAFRRHRLHRLLRPTLVFLPPDLVLARR